MERRKFIAGVGSLAAGGAAALGTGAFERTSAERSARVEVVGDKSAYLRLNPTSPYVSVDGNGALEIDFGAATPAGGQGLNQNSVISFRGLFEIENQGTETVGTFIQDGRSQTEQGGQGDGNLNERLANQGVISGETAAGFFVDTGSAGEASLVTSTWAPDTVDTGRLDDPNDWDPVLEPGDSISVAWFINAEDSSAYEEVNGDVALWAYSQTFASAYQS